ncbi:MULTISPECIES: hypothetical protein [Streptosporangium]|uniref:Uncharacterized protein n=1 Tax=Streptosporangium brasiliense TaxID=47480 RepID=A0ABT9RMF4_9ACTN|nr:hypothetical protein [Streptosporangium brasiliense]MDP9870477.1 hypothetical protein [Streptosporangium brasiliense]
MARAKKKTAAPPAVVRHRPKVVRAVDGTGTVYRLVCPCGTTGREWYGRGPAQEELERHLAALPVVPAAQQCQAPRRHDRRAWEPCLVCELQTALFDLEVAR